MLWGVGTSSKIKMDGEWVDEPKWTIEIGNAEYRFFRNFQLYSNVRSALFLRRMRKRYFPSNNLTEWGTGWEESAQMIYHNAYKAAIAQQEDSIG
jgi:hypothetical protein